MKLLPLSSPLQADLQVVDRIVRQRIQSQPVVAEVLDRRALIGEQSRLHAIFALLAAHVGTYSIERVQHVASTVELIAAAAEVHDRLIDQAERRRATATRQTAWTQGIPLMIGDYLYALAAVEMALVPDPQAISYFSEAVKQISEATLTPITIVRPRDAAEQQYLAQAEGRTAALFAAASMAAGAVSGCTPAQIAALGHFGRSLGLAYQIDLDVKYYSSITTPANGNGGHTFRHAPITLPLIYAVAATNDDRLAALIDESSVAPEQIDWALEQVRTYGIAPARVTSQQFRDQALAALEACDATARQLLSNFALALVPSE